MMIIDQYGSSFISIWSEICRKDKPC
uniref:Uncharacterized protein n=1 Tax=Arundo donax TaxID=35708 RepID=A0A0A9G0H8_ARUDO